MPSLIKEDPIHSGAVRRAVGKPPQLKVLARLKLRNIFVAKAKRKSIFPLLENVKDQDLVSLLKLADLRSASRK